MMKFAKKLAAAALAVGLSTPLLAATEGVDYEVLPAQIPQAQQGKVEVLEFFGYFCPHCRRLDPIIQKHTKAMPSDTYYRTVHVVWDPAHVGLARLLVAVNETNMKAKANGPIFTALIDQGIDLTDVKTAKEWLSSQTGFDGKKVAAALDSFNNQNEAKKMGDLTMAYKIDGTPTVIVGGKYRVIFNNGFENGMKTIDDLVQKVRDEKKMPTPAPKAPAKSKGAKLVKSVMK